jgi:hypothetical protein
MFHGLMNNPVYKLVVIKIILGKLYLKSIRYRNAIKIFGPHDKLQIMYEDGSGLT